MSRNPQVEPADDELVAAVGAVIFASDEPVQIGEIAAAFRGVSEDRIEASVESLEREYAANQVGLRLERVAGGLRLTTRPEVAEWVRLFFRQRNRARLTPAALESLAIVAYRQPVTAPEIQLIRGKDSSAALKGLLDKKLIRILGKKKVVGSPMLYGTGREFLLHFGLDTLDELPAMEDFEEFVGAFESAQVDFVETQDETTDEPTTPAGGAAAQGVEASAEESRPGHA